MKPRRATQYQYTAHSTQRNQPPVVVRKPRERSPLPVIIGGFALLLVVIMAVNGVASLIGRANTPPEAQALRGHAASDNGGGHGLVVEKIASLTPTLTQTPPPAPTEWPSITPTTVPSATQPPTATERPSQTPRPTATITNTPTATLTPTTLAQYLADEYDKLALSRAKRNNVLAWVGVFFGAVVVVVLCSGVLLSVIKHWIKSLRAAWNEKTSGETTQQQVQASAQAKVQQNTLADEAWELLIAAVQTSGEPAAKLTAQIPGHRDLENFGFDRWQRITDWLVSLGLCYKKSGGANPGTYFKTGNLWVWLYVAEIGRLEERGILHNLPTPPDNWLSG